MSIVVLILLSSIFAAVQLRGIPRDEVPALAGAFAAHIMAAFLQFAVQQYYYGISDAYAYMEIGGFMARMMDTDFWRFAPEVGKVILNLPSHFPTNMVGDGGGPTATMAGLAAPICYVFGDSLLAACLVASVLAWSGQLLMYRGLRDLFNDTERRLIRWATMWMPSVVYWGAGFNKEAFALAGLSVLIYGVLQLRNRRWLHVLSTFIGALTVGLVKPYILFPFVLALGAWLYSARRGTIRIRPLHVAAALIIGVGGVLAAGQLFPAFSLSRVAETTAMQQELWTQTDGGSNVEMGSGEARSPLQQLPFVPLAMANSLFRPFLFEARNAPMLGAAIETTGLAILLLHTIWRRRWIPLVYTTLRSPTLMFSLVFVFTFSIAVGLATANLGSLSRYRMPMIPIYATAIWLLRREPSASSVHSGSFENGSP